MANKKSQTINPLVSGAAGAVIGAGIGAAASAAMNNPKTRKKVQRTVRNVQKQAVDYVKSIDEKKINDGKKAVKSIALKTGIGKRMNGKSMNMATKATKRVGRKSSKNK